MKLGAFEQKKLIANFLANVGVAWFAGGVIGIFINNLTDKYEIISSLIWGLGFGFLFLYYGVLMLKSSQKRK